MEVIHFLEIAPLNVAQVSKPLKILFAAPGYKPGYRLGGPILSVAALAEGLVALGHDVTVATTNSNLDQNLDVLLRERVLVDGVDVYYFERVEVLARLFPFIPYFSKPRGYSFAPTMNAFFKMQAQKFDVVHTQVAFTYPTLIAARYAKKFGVPLFYHQRGVLNPVHMQFRGAKKAAYLKYLERPILHAANTLIALTKFEEEAYRLLGVQTPCCVIPNGIDPAQYRQHHQSSFGGIGDDELIILFMGRVHPTKGADRLLEAFIAIADQLQNAHLVMAGPDEYGLQASFENRVAEKNLVGRIHFPGMVSGQQKLDLLARANLFALPSDGEGFSMAILEALASATPVMISPHCNFPEVEQTQSGVIVKNDLSAIGKALVELLSSPLRLKEMGANGLELVLNNYTWEQVCKEMATAYSAGISRTKEKPRPVP